MYPWDNEARLAHYAEHAAREALGARRVALELLQHPWLRSGGASDAPTLPQLSDARLRSLRQSSASLRAAIFATSPSCFGRMSSVPLRLTARFSRLCVITLPHLWAATREVHGALLQGDEDKIVPLNQATAMYDAVQVRAAQMMKTAPSLIRSKALCTDQLLLGV